MMESDRQFSLQVSRALDILGKSQDMIKIRVDHYEKERQDYFANDINVGSKGEGLTSPVESDIDIMHVVIGVMCADNIVPFRHINGITLFESDRQNTAPGYTLLRLDKFEGRLLRYTIKKSLFKACSGQRYLSSDYLVDCLLLQMNHSNVVNSFRNGPAHSFVENSLNLRQDYVTAFQYNCHEIIQSFITRPRDHEWPTNDQLTEISTLEGHVVPIGYKGSETAFCEWRICYTKAELSLIHSLNDTQTKTYILLKMVSKTYISLICKDITSYVLKNIVLWLAECCFLDSFKEDLLVDKVIQALTFLRKCVVNNNLPSYMIPERNLFFGKLDLAKRQKLVILLTDLINEGGGLLMGCERLRGTMVVMYKEPAIAEQYRLTRDRIETMELWLNIDYRNCLFFTDDEPFITIRRTIFSVFIPEFVSLLIQGHDFRTLFSLSLDRLNNWLA